MITNTVLHLDHQHMRVKINDAYLDFAIRYPMNEEIMSNLTSEEQDVLIAAHVRLVTGSDKNLIEAIIHSPKMNSDAANTVTQKIALMQGGNISFIAWLLQNGDLREDVCHDALYHRVCQVYWVIKMIRMAKKK